MSASKYKLRAAYYTQKHRAKTRGIEWEFTFDSWLEVWADSGHIHERGPDADQYCMARTGDQGSYRPDNVRITTNRDNWSEAGEVVAAKWAFMPRPVYDIKSPATPRQLQVLRWIKDFTSEHGMPPTSAEISKAFGWASANAAVEHVAALEKKGLLRRSMNKARAIQITDMARIYMEAA
jgi:hypothetical protein